MEQQKKQHGKILSSIIPLAILLVLVQTATLIGLFQFAFRGVEKYVILKRLQFCVDTLQNELDRINGVAFEWSAWDDTALFIDGKKPDYNQDNMIDKTMLEQDLNVVCIVDLQGNPVLSRCVKIQDDKLIPVDLSILSPESLKNNSTIWNHKKPNSSIAGYYSTEGGALMLSSRPVTNNQNTVPVHGAIIMGRFITDEFITSITKQTCLDFQWWSLRTEYARDALKPYLSRLTDENPLYVESNPKTATAYTILRDIDGKEAVLIKFVLANEVAFYKDGWMVKCLGIYAIEGLVFVIYLAAFANKHCQKCHAQITHDAQSTQAKEYPPSNKSKKRKTFISIPY